MKTDIEIFKIFQLLPDWLFLLTGLPSPGKSTLQTVSLKSLERTADVVIVPESMDEKITVLEIQFQKDVKVYTRLVVEMALTQEAHDGREVQGIILFRDRKLDPQTRPWSQIIHAFSLNELLQEFEAQHPHHPLAAVFKPVFLEDTQAPAQNAASYYRDITQWGLDDQTKSSLVEVLVSWLLQRFTDLGRKEIEAMLITELPSLEETKAGKELIELGEKRGEKRGEERGEERGEKRGRELGLREALIMYLEAKHTAIPADIRQQVSALGFEKAQQLLSLLARCDDLDMVREWLAENKS